MNSGSAIMLLLSVVLAASNALLTPFQLRYRVSRAKCAPIKGFRDKIQPCYNFRTKKLVKAEACGSRFNKHCCVYDCKCIIKGAGTTFGRIPPVYRLSGYSSSPPFQVIQNCSSPTIKSKTTPKTPVSITMIKTIPTEVSKTSKATLASENATESTTSAITYNSTGTKNNTMDLVSTSMPSKTTPKQGYQPNSTPSAKPFKTGAKKPPVVRKPIRRKPGVGRPVPTKSGIRKKPPYRRQPPRKPSRPTRPRNKPGPSKPIRRKPIARKPTRKPGSSARTSVKKPSSVRRTYRPTPRKLSTPRTAKTTATTPCNTTKSQTSAFGFFQQLSNLFNGLGFSTRVVSTSPCD